MLSFKNNYANDKITLIIKRNNFKNMSLERGIFVILNSKNQVFTLFFNNYIYNCIHYNYIYNCIKCLIYNQLI